MAGTTSSTLATSRKSTTPSQKFERQRSRILDAATLLLNEKGVAGLTLQEVAQQLGLKTTAVTYYFRYKDQLIAAVFADSLDRLAEMVAEAGLAETPRDRVDRYLKIHFDHYAAALRGNARPLAILSEIRALDDAPRRELIAQYQTIFRNVRAFFGPTETVEQKLRLTAKAQMLNEMIFWSAIWLRQYAITDFDNVRRRLLDILERGIASKGHRAAPRIYEVDPEPGKVDSRIAFLRSMTKLINDTGHKGTSIDRVAAEVNLTKGSFYHHLETKDDLILECFYNSYKRLGTMNARALSDGLGKYETLVSIIYSAIKIQFQASYPLLRTTALQALPTPVRESAVEYAGRTTLFLTGLIADAMQEGLVRPVDPLLASHLITSTINSAYDIRNWAAKQDMDAAVQRYANGIIDGIIGPP